MEFTFDTRYNAKTMAVMARALRKTVRQKHSRRSRLFGWIVTAMAVLLMTSGGFELNFRSVLTLGVIFVIVATLLFEDWINGYVAQKRMMPGMERATAVFTPEGFVSTTEIGKTEWNYDKILLVAETKDFFVFIFSHSHAQLYDKAGMEGGTADDFRAFLEGVTGKRVERIK